MSQEFKNVKVATGRRSTFDLSHDQVTTSDFGKILPIMVRECLPGDKWTIDPNVFIRLAPLAVPTYGRIKCRVHTFFVPNRILWKDWDNYITGSSLSNPPYLMTDDIRTALLNDPAFSGTTGSVVRGRYTSLLSNIGINPTIFGPNNASVAGIQINAFPFLAYHRIWFDYFRDSNLNTSETWFDQFTSGGNLGNLTTTLLKYHNACFKKDYFTTAKLNPQSGPTGQSASVFTHPESNISLGRYEVLGNVDSNSIKFQLDADGAGHGPTLLQGVYVSAIRTATAFQRYLERNNYVGARTISRLLAHFGVQPSAERLDMAEYVGGSDFNVQIADVTSTSQYSQSSPWGTTGLGSQAGKGIGAGSIKGCEYFCKEHGILMSVISILPDTGYYQGISKMWTRGFNGDGKFEYFTSEFESLGFQPILNRELFIPNDPTQYINYSPSGIFGYTPRYSDYKFQMDVLGGDFVATDTASGADSFHLFRKLNYTDSSPLALNENFTSLINENTDYDRIFQVSTNTLDHFYCDIHVKAIAERNMVDFMEPSIADVQEGEGRKVELPYGGIRL